MKKITLLVALCAAMNLLATEPEWSSEIEIEGQKITALNGQNLHELLNASKIDKQKEMSVTFDLENSVLLFQNAFIVWSDAKTGPFLKIDEPLTIKVEGENQIVLTDSKSFIETTRNVSFIGTQKEERDALIVYGHSTEGSSGIFACLNGNDVNLEFEKVTVSANQCINALVGSAGQAHKVTFNYAKFGMQPQKEATLEITDMVFNHSKITKPAGAEFSPELKGIAKDGKLVAGEQVIINLADDEAIENIQSETRNQKVFHDGQLLILRDGEVFNAQGARVE